MCGMQQALSNYFLKEWMVGMQPSAATMENSVEISWRTGSGTSMWPSGPTSGHAHRGNQVWGRRVHPSVHHSTVYHGQDMEAA